MISVDLSATEDREHLAWLSENSNLQRLVFAIFEQLDHRFLFDLDIKPNRVQILELCQKVEVEEGIAK